MQETEKDPIPEHKPYIAASEFIPEFTPKAIILGAIFGIIFGAASVYLGLKVGLTVSASIPIAVLAISIFKKIGKATILESNIVQTIGSAGESVAAGVVFTIPALLFLAGGIDYFQYFQIFVLAFAGGILGVLFMVPLRKSLIVKEHGNLPYPEGTACADVLIAGETGGKLAEKVYYGLGIAFLYKLFMSIIGLWKDVPAYVFDKTSVMPNASISAETTPELLGVGYIIGPKIAGVMMAGAVLSYLVLVPLISFIGGNSTMIIAPGDIPIGKMNPDDIRSFYIKYIGAGAVTFGGIMTLIKTLPTIVSAFKDSFKDLRKGKEAGVEKLRTQRELPISYVLIGSLILVLFIAFIPKIEVGILPAIMIVIFGFFFVTVSSRIVGIIGSSSNPISGMTIATIMATCLIFVAIGWTGDAKQPIALIVGSIVCIASANAGATSQDLKTGYIVGATPIKQQLGLLIGVFVSTIAIGFTLKLLVDTYGIGVKTPGHDHPLGAPQAILMSTIIKGLLSHKLPWSLVIIGMGVSAVMELCGISSLAFAVGAYLPFSTTSPIFVGGIVKWIIEKRAKSKAEAESELGPGALFSSGLIAGGALTGIAIAALYAIKPGKSDISILQMINTGIADKLGTTGDILGIVAFVVLAIVLWYFASRKTKELA